MYAEMRKGPTSPNGGLYIEMAHLGPERVAKQFKGMVQRCADCGFDLAGGRVEVVPTAHYLMGGVICEADTSTEIPRLYVAGEDAGGMHGANRLGGNGVANSTVYGGIAGDVIAAAAMDLAFLEPDEAAIAAEIERALYPLAKPRGDINRLREKLLDLMWDKVGVIRSAEQLAAAAAGLAELDAELCETGLGGQPLDFNLTWHDWLNLRSLLDVSRAITLAALTRENSRGAHYRTDFPDQGDLHASAYTVVRQKHGELLVGEEPVTFSIVAPGQSLLTEAA
jgi:fumarate reductase flavoprotein subunit